MKRDQFTIRAPNELLDRVREEASIYGDSMNDLMIAAIEKEVSMRARVRLMNLIERERREIEKRGVQPDSSLQIRQFRTGVERRET